MLGPRLCRRLFSSSIPKSSFQMGGIKANGQSPRIYDTVSVEQVSFAQTQLANRELSNPDSSPEQDPELFQGVKLSDSLSSMTRKSSSSSSSSLVELDYQDDRAWIILLNGRMLITPNKSPMVLPSKLVALAVAAEWERQGKYIRPTSMPFNSLATCAIDGYGPASNVEIRQKHFEDLFKFIPTDTVCYRDSSVPGLRDRQDRILDPILEWVKDHYGISLEKVQGFSTIDSMTDSTVRILQEEIFRLSPWQLASMDSVVKLSKSYIVGLALIHGRLTAQQVFSAARVEEEFQIEQWGEVAGGHDLDSAYMRMKIQAAHILQKLIESK